MAENIMSDNEDFRQAESTRRIVEIFLARLEGTEQRLTHKIDEMGKDSRASYVSQEVFTLTMQLQKQVVTSLEERVHFLQRVAYSSAGLVLTAVAVAVISKVLIQ